MGESSAWSTLRKVLVHELPGRVHIQRFEDKFTAGIPDTNICWEGEEIWLEGKFLKKYPARNSSLVKIGLRVEQSAWLTLRQRAGGRCFVWCRVPDGWMLFDSQWDLLRDGMPLGLFREHELFDTTKRMVGHLKANVKGDKWYGRVV
jgi:hypothetical protein